MICSQAIHSGFDFGLYMPANAILCAALAGMTVAKIVSSDSSEARWTVPASPSVRIAETALLVVLVVWLGWGTYRSFSRAKVEAAFNESFDATANDSHNLADIDRSIANFENAIVRLPGDAEAQFRLAELQIQRYRILAVADLRKTITSNDELLWQLTLPVSLHRRVHALGEDSVVELEKLSRQPRLSQQLQPAVENLLRARRNCPLMNKTHFRLAELFIAMPDRKGVEFDDSELVQTAVRLAPNDPDVLFRAGLLDWHAGRDATALAEWRKSLTLSSQYAVDVFGFLTQQEMAADEVVAEIAPVEPHRIVDVARQLKDDRYRFRLAEKASESISLASPNAGMRANLQGAILELKGETDAAIEKYNHACAANPDNVTWRHQLSLLLLRNKRYKEATKRAAECIRLAPGDERFRELLKRIRLESRQQESQ